MSATLFQIRYNPMQLTAFSAFAQVNGGYRQQTKDVYFVRFVGCTQPDAYLRELAQLDQLLAKKKGAALRVLSFPQLSQSEQLTQYANTWQSAAPQLSYKASDPLLQATIQLRLEELPAIYQRYQPNASPSMVKNFMVKVLFWADVFFPQLFCDWQIQRSPKFVCSGALKKQEYVFLYFLTQLGVDVLYLNPEGDLPLDQALLQLSAKNDCHHYNALILPQFHGDQPTTAAEQPRSSVSATVEKSPSSSAPVQTTMPEMEKSFEELATLASSIVMIEVYDSQGICFKTGSGIIIGAEGYILTNFHVVCDSSSYQIKLEGEEQSYPCQTLIKYNYVHDLALLRIDRNCTPLTIYRGPKPLIRGQKVVAIGSPMGLFNSVSDGIISGFRTIQDTPMIQFTAPTSPGSSGGALLNMRGEIIGICTAGITEGQNLNLAVDYGTILSFVSGFLPHKN